MPFGFAYGLLAADMIEAFLLHFFTISAHSYTRGTWTTPESASINRDVPTVAYASAGVNNVPLYLKWALVFEEPESRTLWLGKAVPREWLAAGEAPIVVHSVPSRYGRVSMRLSASMSGGGASRGVYVVRANVSVASSFVTSGGAPAGGLRLRLRCPLAYAGRLSRVTVGGSAWKAFSASMETIDVSRDALITGGSQLATSLKDIVATFA